MLIFLLSSLLAIAEETLAEFMSKATGTAVKCQLGANGWDGGNVLVFLDSVLP
jgi:hypothetical protein